MTLTTTNATHIITTRLTYEQIQPSFPWTRHRKTVLVRSDNERLSQVIIDSLHDVCPQSLSSPKATDLMCDEADLIIAVVSGPHDLPVVTLTRPDISRLVGKIPIVMLSQHPFDSQEIKRIHFLPLPIQPAALREQVLALLA